MLGLKEPTVALPDGARIHLRPLRAEDKPLLQATFEHLGSQSRYSRFLGVHNEALSARELRYFTEVDHRTHEAIVAVDPATGEGIGVARYVVAKGDPSIAEVAVTVVDEWQGRGVGTALMRELGKHARNAGVKRFHATMFSTNARMYALLCQIGEPRLTGSFGTTVDYELDLGPSSA